VRLAAGATEKGIDAKRTGWPTRGVGASSSY
jgi:hypothetical protein